MNCLKCGNPISPGTTFCTSCGAGVPPTSSGVKTMVTSPRTLALSALKNPLYLITGIVFVASLLFTVYSVFTMLDDIHFFEVASDSEKMIILVSLAIAILPQLLLGIGILVSAAKSRSGLSDGIGCVKAGFITQTVFLSLATAGLLFALIKAMNHGASLNGDITLSLMLVIGIIVMVFAYLARCISTFSIVQNAVNKDSCHGKTSVYAIIIGYLFAVLYFYVGFEGLNNASELGREMRYAAMDFGVQEFGEMAAISMILSGLCYALLASSMILFRKIEVSTATAGGYSSSAFVGGGATPISELGRTTSGFCSSCGRPLPPSGICSCGFIAPGTTYAPVAATPASFAPSAAPIYPAAPTEPKTPVVPETPATSAAVPEVSAEKHFCIHCGKVLIGAEICSCSKSFGGATPVSTVPDPSSVSGGLRSTMRAPRKNVDEKEMEDLQRGKSFFGTGGNLD